MIIERKVKLLYNGEKVEKTLIFKEVDYETAKEMIIANHYSHKWNTAFGKINIGVFINERLLGVASFGNLMNPKSYSKIGKDLQSNNVIELNRLWVDDELGKNTETTLLGACWKIMKSDYPEIKVIQSFADGRLGCGTIYKAASFKYYGFTESLFFENIETKETQHKVPMENTMRPDGMVKINSDMVIGKLVPFTVKTYRYIYLLDREIEISLKELPYPVYDKGINYIENYDVYSNTNTISRAFVLAKIFGYEKEFENIHNFIKTCNIEEVSKQVFSNGVKNVCEKRGKLAELQEFYLWFVDTYYSGV